LESVVAAVIEQPDGVPGGLASLAI
jgi:hypothetical protein